MPPCVFVDFVMTYAKFGFCFIKALLNVHEKAFGYAKKMETRYLTLFMMQMHHKELKPICQAFFTRCCDADAIKCPGRIRGMVWFGCRGRAVGIAVPTAIWTLKGHGSLNGPRWPIQQKWSYLSWWRPESGVA